MKGNSRFFKEKFKDQSRSKLVVAMVEIIVVEISSLNESK